MKFYIVTLWVLLSSFSYSQWGIETKYEPNEISPALTIQHVFAKPFAYELFRSDEFYWNVLRPTVIIKDPFNSNKVSVSYYGPISLISILGITVMTQYGGGEGCNFPDIAFSDTSIMKPIFGAIGRACVAAILLSNSDYHFNIIGCDSLSTSQLGTSAFKGTQTDLFIRQYGWARFAIRSGIETSVRLHKKDSDRGYHGSVLAVQVGVSKGWDISAKLTKSEEYFIFVETKLSFQ